MNILFYRYGNICEDSYINAFSKSGLTVFTESNEVSNKAITNEERLNNVEKHIKELKPIFVFSINFFPVIAQLCNIYKIFYICQTVDAPVMELYSQSITYNTNRIFMFDYKQYETFKIYNPENIFYLPLASDIEHFNKVTSSISQDDYSKYSCDISFVGSLYNEKDRLLPLLANNELSKHTQGYIAGLTDTSLKLYGYYPAADALTDTLVSDIKNHIENYVAIENPMPGFDEHAISQYYLGYHISSVERVNTLNALAKHFRVDLFTRSYSSLLEDVKVHDGVKTLTEMPKIFNLSKINLNMTIKPIQTGLPLRIFDIMGCGGFLMTNYQEELAEYFEIGKELEAYSSIDELTEKCDYYLSHEDIRKQIAINGFNKVSSSHTYSHRINSIIKTIVGGN